MSYSLQEKDASRSRNNSALFIRGSSDDNIDEIPLTDMQHPEKAYDLSRDDTSSTYGDDRAPFRSSLDDARHRFSAAGKEDEMPLVTPSPPPPPTTVREKPVTWASLPRKGQLAILTFARFSEPLAQTSLMAYMFYQLKWFDPSLPDSTISWQVGILQASFSAVQFFTAALWGKVADHIGRKPVVLIGLIGLCLSCFAYAFSTTFIMAVVIRAVGGGLNGNVGVMRTIVSEIVPEKKYQPQAFLLLPTFLNIGTILGPIVGGFLADPVHNLPRIFGEHSLLGGTNGVSWMKHWPYALPSLVTGTILSIAIILVFLGLDETHEEIKHKPDNGRKIAECFLNLRSFRRSTYKYTPLGDGSEPLTTAALEGPQTGNAESSMQCKEEVLSQISSNPPFRQVWTRNVIFSLASHFFLIFSIATFNALLFTFLPTPRSSSADTSSDASASHLAGGLGLSQSNVGLATSFIGVIGFPTQLVLYPMLQSRFGTLKNYRTFFPFSAVAAFLIPLLVLLPNRAWAVWLSLIAILALQVLGGTMALPGSIIMINESVPMAQVKGLVHGVGQSVASAGKTVGPVLGGWGLGMGLKHNAVEAVWWVLGAVTLLGWVCTWTIREKEGSDEEKEEASR